VGIQDINGMTHLIDITGKHDSYVTLLRWTDACMKRSAISQNR